MADDDIRDFLGEVLSGIKEAVAEHQSEKRQELSEIDKEKSRVESGERTLELMLSAAKFDHYHGPNVAAYERIPVGEIISLSDEALEIVRPIYKAAAGHIKKQYRFPAVAKVDGLMEAIALSGTERFPLVIASLFDLLDDKIEYEIRSAITHLVGKLLTADTVTNVKDYETLVVLLAFVSSYLSSDGEKPFGNAICSVIASQVAQQPASELVVQALKEAEDVFRYQSESSNSWLAAEIRKAQQPQDQAPLSPDHEWVKNVFAHLDSLPKAQRNAWAELVRYAQTANGSKPSKNWMSEAVPLLTAVGETEFAETLKQWCEWVLAHKVDDWAFKPTENGDAIKGLLWICMSDNVTPPYGTIADIAEYGYRKIAWHGASAPTIANAAMLVLCNAPDMDGIGYLSSLNKRIKYAHGKHIIKQRLKQAAEERGMTTKDLVELSVPDFGLNANGERNYRLGDHVATVAITDEVKTSLIWSSTKGKIQASIPAAVKRDFAAQLKDIRKTVKDIDKIRAGVQSRLEMMYLSPRSLSYSEWFKRYIEHSVTGTLGRRVVWNFKQDKTTVSGLYQGEKVIGSDGKALSVDLSNAEVSLWHPLNSELNKILQWRATLDSLEITQPFKQAHREVYLVTDAERESRNVSNRFAGHILKQHQFKALCQERGWEFSLQGSFDGHNDAYRELEPLKLEVELQISEFSDEQTASGIYVYVATGQVRIDNQHDQMDLVNVEPLVFSEIMRDVDLFVGVCSVSNDPTWMELQQNQDFYRYAERSAFGDLSESAQSRRAALESIIPKLKIKDQITIGKRFVRVTGKLDTYKIHMGSANVMMESSNQYLCIVPKSRKASASIRLPFEGDATLSLIISKLMLLAADDKIKDQVILNQFALST